MNHLMDKESVRRNQLMGFASLLEGAPCCLYCPGCSLLVMVWICKAEGIMLNSGLLSKWDEEACFCWMCIFRIPSNLLIFRGQIYTHLALCKLCFHFLKIEVGNYCFSSWAEGYSLKEILGNTIFLYVLYLDFYTCANTASFLLFWFPCESCIWRCSFQLSLVELYRAVHVKPGRECNR